MNYTIHDIARKFGLSAHTIRYYDKEGLFPFIGRNSSGNRVFTEADLEWVALICCLKDTGMPIKEMKRYVDWCTKGRETIEARKGMLSAHRQAVLRQVEDLNRNLDILDAKIALYNSPDAADILEERLSAKKAAAQQSTLT
ncbi:MerR family transcriptional regulator [Paenibacillus sp. HJGM_3]|uniref:MerR family transcriptional regulator n=1 Tax=Paenibacillus sp. HJGM_3 TaxID=3379816 RepID=UPI00385A4607